MTSEANQPDTELTEELEPTTQSQEEAPTPPVVPNLSVQHTDSKGVAKSLGKFADLEAAMAAADAVELKKGEAVTITPLVYFREEV